MEIDIHQLRHSHAAELINVGVSIEGVGKRLRHASTETTQVYAPSRTRTPTMISAPPGGEGRKPDRGGVQGRQASCEESVESAAVVGGGVRQRSAGLADR
ncbi:tyrosine-type recombinase/integrase [Nocardia sputi]|uniref:tyrosine-type recombinase/integrase n=1 Tax=Nocardia sputi TaxID=2943705 RepID=UPI00355732F0